MTIYLSCKGRERGSFTSPRLLLHNTNESPWEKQKGRNKGPSLRVSGNTPLLSHCMEGILGPVIKYGVLSEDFIATSLLVGGLPNYPFWPHSQLLPRPWRPARRIKYSTVLYSTVNIVDYCALQFRRETERGRRTWNASCVLLKFSG